MMFREIWKGIFAHKVLLALVTGLVLAGIIFFAFRKRDTTDFECHTVVPLYSENPYIFFEPNPGGLETARVGQYNQDFWKEDAPKWTIHINSLKLRGPEVEIRPREKTFRILCLGDSNVAGFELNDDQTYPAFLEKTLNKNLEEPLFQVFNGGVIGSFSLQGLYMLETEYYKLDPDLIIVSFGPNDGSPCERNYIKIQRILPTSKIVQRDDATGKWLPYRKDLYSGPGYYVRLFWVSLRSRLDYLWRRLSGKLIPNIEQAQMADISGCRTVPLEDYEKTLRLFLDFTEKRDKEVFFLEIAETLKSYRDTAKRIAKENRKGFMDAPVLFPKLLPLIRYSSRFENERKGYVDYLLKKYKTIPNDLFYTTDYGHPNPVGTRVIAELLVLHPKFQDAVHAFFESKHVKDPLRKAFEANVNDLFQVYGEFLPFPAPETDSGASGPP